MICDALPLSYGPAMLCGILQPYFYLAVGLAIVVLIALLTAQ